MFWVDCVGFRLVIVLGIGPFAVREAHLKRVTAPKTDLIYPAA